MKKNKARLLVLILSFCGGYGFGQTQTGETKVGIEQIETIRAQNVQVVSGTYSGSSVAAALSASDAADGDKSATNEIQSLSFQNGVLGLTGQSQSVSQSQLNYWTLSGNNVYRGGFVGFGTAAPSSQIDIKMPSSGSKSEHGIFIRKANISSSQSFLRINSGTSNVTRFLPMISARPSYDAPFFVRGIQHSDTQNNETLRFAVSNSSESGVISDSSIATTFYNWNICLMKIMGNGDVGVGDILPSEKFDVAGKIKQRVQSEYAASNKFAVFGGVDNNVIGYRTFDPATTSYWTYNSIYNSIYNAAGTAVGINTQSPIFAFEVTAKPSQTNTAAFRGDTAGDVPFFFANYASYSEMNNGGTAATAERIILNESGFVGLQSENAILQWNKERFLKFDIGSTGPGSNQPGAVWFELEGSDIELKVNSISEEKTVAYAIDATTNNEQKISRKIAGEQAYENRLVLSSALDDTTVAFATVPNMNRPFRLDFVATTSNGQGIAGNGSSIINSGVAGEFVRVYWQQSTGEILIRNESGGTLTNIEVYPQYTKN